VLPAKSRTPLPLGGLLAIGLAATLIFIAVAFWALCAISTGTLWFWEGRPDGKISVFLTSAEYLDFVRSSVTFGGAVALGATLLLAFRRQQTNDRLRFLAEQNLTHERTKESSRLSELADQRTVEMERELRSRFAAVSAQLGHEKSAVRLAGIYALGALADEWHAFGRDDERQVCIDVLCAYVRLPYDPDSERAQLEGEREVRLTAIKVVRDHLRANANENANWRSCAIDFSGTTFDGGDLSGIVIDGGVISFAGSKFVRNDFSLAEAVLSDGSLDFAGARMADGSLNLHGFRQTGGTVSFNGFVLLSGSLRMTHMKVSKGIFDCSELTQEAGLINFASSAFVKSTLLFDSAVLAGGRLLFQRTRFNNTEINFYDTMLRGVSARFFGCNFKKSKFSFEDAQFESGRVTFLNSTFNNSDLSFESAVFNGAHLEIKRSPHHSGMFLFQSASFNSGQVNLDSSSRQGGTIEFEGASVQLGVLRMDGAEYNPAAPLTSV